MKVLFIEDNVDQIQGIIDYVDEKQEWEFMNVTFKDALSKFMMYYPDLVVMDWMYDAERANEGEPIFKAIYENEFVPTIIFSAIAATLPDDVFSNAEGNPMIEVIPKGDEQIVIERMNKWEPYINAVKDSKMELNSSLISSAKAMAYYFTIKDIDETVIKYMLRKRIKDSFPNQEDEKFCPPAWIEYEYPPICETILAADILRTNEGDINDVAEPENYLVVLTPSCDMARINPEENKQILVAECESAISLLSVPSKDEKKNISRYIYTGYNYSKVPLPELPTKIPYMTINLKSIKLIGINDIALDEQSREGKNFFRVASISSPFRENVVWAHMINSCRPGMPERDVKTWADAIASAE